MNDAPGREETLRPLSPERRRRIAAIVVAFAAVLATALSALGPYSIWDDEVFIDESPFQTLNPAAAAATILRGDAHPGWAYYPVLHLSLGLDVLLFRGNPFLSHLLNICLHAVNALLVWAALRAAFRETLLWSEPARLSAATFGALLFAVHPLNVEPVAWVSGRKVLLGFLFAMSAFLCVARRAPRMRLWIAAVACCALALLSNALLLAFPLLIGAWFVWTQRCYWTAALLRAAPFLALAVLAALIRVLGESTEGKGARQIRDLATVAGEAAAFFDAQARLLGRVFLPVGLLPVYPSDTLSFAAPGAWGGLVLAAIAVLAVVASARRASPLRRLAGWGALWYVLALLPTAAHHLHLADRYFYFAGVGFCVAAGAAAGAAVERLGRTPARRRLVSTVGGAVLALLLAASIRQSLFWRSDLILFRRAALGAPSNPIARNNYGFALLEEKRVEEAIPEFEAALRASPRHVNALINLAAALSSKKELDRAVDLFLRAIETRPGEYRAHIGLASTLMELDRPDQALIHFQEAVRLKPWRYEAHYGLAAACLRTNRYDLARKHYEETAALKPDWPYGISGLAQALALAGEKEKARELYEKALERSLAAGDAALERWIRGELNRIERRDEEQR